MNLFTPFSVKNMQVRNRIVMPPMCMYCAGEDGIASPFHFSHYTARAVGGAGLIVMEATGVLPRGRISDHCLGLWNDEQAKALAPIVAACQEQGAKMAIQLNHAGRKCEAKAEPFIHAPSAVAFDENARVPQQMTEADMQETVDAFRAAAKRAADIGFDAVEIHAAHGYLLSEFLSPLTNQRTDCYGGSVENRCRFVIEVLKAVHEVWPEDKPVLLRISAEDYASDGMHPEQMAEVLRCLKPYIDVVDVSTGGVIPAPPSKLYPGYQLKAAEYLRKNVGLPVITVGLIVEPRLIEEILGNERADLVA
ncbi:MAG: NADH:flavin oxidoreductase/NADH oxidase, partial [Agathobaculum sp.]|uniref:NADH:flavin oxidoreductase/NADH oxidase n=1 Tax=Agathobaculum sp. TaxID=2048138 RepID=UPI003D91BE00